MGAEVEDGHAPLGERLLTCNDESEEGFKRRGTVWTATAHIITAVIGAGVLSLAWSVAQLGWVAGPLILLLFAAITVVSVNLLSDCYRSPHPRYGPARNRSYMDAVNFFLGERIG